MEPFSKANDSLSKFTKKLTPFRGGDIPIDFVKHHRTYTNDLQVPPITYVKVKQNDTQII